MNEREKQLFHTVMCKNTNSYSPEETSVFHVLCVFIIRFLRTNADPEEVLWLLPFINHLGDTLIDGAVTAFFTAKGTQSSLESLKERPMLPLVTSESLISCIIIFTNTPAELLRGGWTVKSCYKQVFGAKSQSDDAVKFHHCRGDV